MESLINLTSWLTPTTLFFLLNFVIFTIFITARFSSGSISKNHNQYSTGSGHHELHTPTPLTKAPSIFDRLKSSINFNFYKSPSPFLSEIHLTGSDPNPNPPSTLLARVKSINIPFFKFEFPLHNREIDYAAYELSTKSNPAKNFKIDEEELRIEAESSDLDHPSILARVKSFKLLSFSGSGPESNSTRQEEDLPIGSGSSDLDAPSILERVKSFKLLPINRSEPESNPILQEEVKPVRTKSEAIKPGKMKKKKKKLRKSASEKLGLGYIGREVETVAEVEMRRPETVRVEKTAKIGEDEEECVNDKASNFINKFKQQLKLQRLDSFLRYREMLKND